MDQSTINYFIRFLKEEKLYAPFMCNYKAEEGGVLGKLKIFHFLSVVEDYNVLINAYRWTFTNEGKPFWRMINHKWNLLLKLKEKGIAIYR